MAGLGQSSLMPVRPSEGNGDRDESVELEGRGSWMRPFDQDMEERMEGDAAAEE